MTASVPPSSADFLSVLNPEQLEAVTHTGSPLLILAGAGSGKTRVITTKIAYLISVLGYDPRSILAVTFTKKAANEMSARAVRLEPRASRAHIRTFHSFGSWFLRVYGEEAGMDPGFTVYDDDDMAALLAKAKPSLLKKDAALAAHYISRAKDWCLPPDADSFAPLEMSAEMRELYSLYEKKLRSTGNVDFGDLIMLPVRILQSDERIRDSIRRRFKVIMVDEYQDSNVAQFQLLRELAGDDTYVCVVGDDDQSIYSFRGAEVKNILTFPEHFPHTQIIRLERNYRSVSPILHAAGNVVACNRSRLGKVLKAERGDGAKPVLAFLPSQDDEAAYCAELISRSHEKGCPYADWAVLYRTNAQSLSFETEFLRRKIPYSVVGSLRFYEREEIKDMLSLLKFIVNPKDEISFGRIINKPPRGIGAATLEKIISRLGEEEDKTGSPSLLTAEPDTGLIAACRSVMPGLQKKARTGLGEFIGIVEELLAVPGMGLAEKRPSLAERLADESVPSETPPAAAGTETLSLFISKVAEISGLTEYYKAQDEISSTQRAGNIAELANSAVFYPLNRAGLLDFLDHIELDRSLEIRSENQKDSVTLITLHNTKGLEFPRVIITGMEKGVFPRGDKKGDELEEERRLFYVGITRARDELYLTSCENRRLYGRTEFMSASPFLYEVGQDAVKTIGNIPRRFADYMCGAPVSGDDGAPDPIAERWPVGRRLYHDEYGYGYIVRLDFKDGEYLIKVRFETGYEKSFLPAYQSHNFILEED